jgi:hypothetical protein
MFVKMRENNQEVQFLKLILSIEENVALKYLL